MWKSNKIAILYSAITLFVTFILGQILLILYPDGNTIGSSVLFILMNLIPMIVILTDRDELNTQISDTFENCGLLGKTKSAKYIATSGDDLIPKLQGNPSFIFTLIQKFNKKDVQPIISDHDIIIMSDEAHRSQYGIFADNMMNLLPTVARIGFTGTPLLSNDILQREHKNCLYPLLP